MPQNLRGMDKSVDYLIVGSGIIGLSIARSLKRRDSSSTILLIDKEEQLAAHASGRNSGVLHAGFYYTADSLKARFTVEGNKALKQFCSDNGLAINECGKLIVAADESELPGLDELARRGRSNGAQLEIVSAEQAKEIEPRAHTFERAIYSPATATVSPAQVVTKLAEVIQAQGVELALGVRYLGFDGGKVHTSGGVVTCGRLINAAGLHADKIAAQFGFGLDYTILPFKGLYLKYAKNKTDINTNIYPVPNLRNPFLGVHFTKTVDGTIKIGPTAIPAFWRENYKGFSGFSAAESLVILSREADLFLRNSFNFRNLAFEELQKFNKRYFIGLAKKLAPGIDENGFGEFGPAGIRAQLLKKSSRELVQDFVVEGDEFSTHVLNAVSPGFTCAFPFGEYVVDEYIL